MPGATPLLSCNLEFQTKPCCYYCLTPMVRISFLVAACRCLHAWQMRLGRSLKACVYSSASILRNKRKWRKVPCNPTTTNRTLLIFAPRGDWFKIMSEYVMPEFKLFGSEAGDAKTVRPNKVTLWNWALCQYRSNLKTNSSFLVVPTILDTWPFQVPDTALVDVQSSKTIRPRVAWRFYAF